MSIVEFLTLLAELDIRLWVEDGKLRYSAPEGAFTDEIRNQVVDRKAELIDFLGSARKAGQESIPRVERSQPLQLSFAQQRLWFLNQLEPDNSAYNMPAAVRITGDLQVDILQRVIGEIVRRHEILRTVYREDRDQTHQVILPAADWHIAVEPLQIDRDQDETTVLLQLSQQEASTPFDLSSGPVLRSRLLQLNNSDRYILLVTLHHIASDGWSMGILVSEIAALYKAFAEGKPSPLPEPEIQYADYAAWQYQRISGELLNKQLSYWKSSLNNTPILQLPTDQPRSAILGAEGKSHSFRLNAELTNRLNQLSNQHDATLFMTLLAAFNVLLFRFSQQDDFAVGIPIANRSHSSLDTLVGCFVNTLAIRSDVSDELNFLELLDAIRSTTRAGYEHQDIPFERIVDELGIPRDMSHTPVFQVMFTLQNTPADNQVSLPGVELELLEFDAGTAQFELKLAVAEAGDELFCVFEYNAGLFEAATIERLARYFQLLLRHVVHEPATSIREIPLITATEKAQLLSTREGSWNATTVHREAVNSLHSLFEQQVVRTPTAIAVRDESRALSYSELNEQANQLAHYLRHQGIQPDSLVGIAMERAVDMSIALLAVLKAGGAYVPFDPSFPEDRLHFMLEDTQVSVMLSQAHLAERLPANDAQLLCVDSDRKLWSNQPRTNVEAGVREHHLFNVIFTSGSTGRPKGVMVPHKGIINRLQWMQSAYPIGADDLVLQKTPYSFDVSVWELFWPLIVGSQLIYARPEGHKDPDYLRDFIIAHGVTTLHFVPSMLGIFLQAAEIENCRSIRRVFCSGEALQLEHERRFFERLGQSCQELHNLYGPTEASVDVSYFACQPNSRYRSIPIGKPVDNTQLHILDKNLQPVPIGIVGELYIGGVQLARGYLNREELTQNTFIENPYHDQGHPSRRLYKTGDLCRYLADGNIEYIGRVDFQVKVRGLRIELGEIETVLHQHPLVRETIVITRDLGAGNVIIVAYVVLEDNQTEGDAESFDPLVLRSHLKEHIPEYMIPNAFVVLDEIPLSPNGKANRKALPEPDLGQQLSSEYVAPRNDIEQTLAEIWQEILGLDKIGVNDNFFELGGHSLLATRVMTRIRERFAVQLPLKTLFQDASIANLAHSISCQDEQPTAINLRPRDSGDAPVLMSFAQQRLWLIDNIQKDSIMYNMPFGVRIDGALNKAALRKALETIVDRHEVLRSYFSQQGKDGLQHVMSSSDFLAAQDFPEELHTDNRDSAAGIIAEFAATPFKLREGPLFRALLIHVKSEDTRVLMLNMHHSVSDGWSMNILLQELNILYHSYAQGQDNPLPPLEIQYADYALWQREWLQGDILEQQLAYWRSRLANTPVLQLPIDHPRPSQLSGEGRVINFSIDTALADRLRALAVTNAATLHMTLLAAFEVLLYRCSGQDDFCIGVPIANRNHPQLEGMIGFFVNSLAMRSDIDAEDNFATLLSKVRQSSLDAHQHQDIPFEKLVDELNIPRDLSNTPLFQVMFSLESFASDAARSSGDAANATHFTVLSTEDGSHDVPVKFDLQLAMSDAGAGQPIRCSFEFRRSLFESSTVANLSHNLLTLLHSISEDQDSPLSRLSMVSDAERKRLLATSGDAWNATTKVREPRFEALQGLHQLFEQQVQQTPDAIAVAYEDSQWSYQQLNRQANRLARHLQSLGVGPDIMVGVAMERSLDMSLALLAILKAGGAYVPFDPSFPQERLGYMLEDTEVPVMLSQQHLSEALPRGNATLICLDQDSAAWQSGDDSDLPCQVNPDNLINVIFTSGSTGKPKGVMVPHRGVINRLLWMQESYPLDAADVVLQKTPYSFDVSVWELFWPLLFGAQIRYARPDGHKDADYLRELIIERQVTTLHFVPSMLGQFLQAENIEQCRSIKRVFCSGEALQLEHERRFFARLGHAELHNLYGPTEASIDVSYFACQPNSTYRSVPIGKPVDNTQLHILDGKLQPVPVGIVGELYIGGVQLARGYLKREELTASTFIDNPFVAEGHPSPKLYKTGDLARYRADGNIEYIGRVDFQVKVRGLRIELGEIESVLHQHPGVRETIVITRDLGDNNVVIVAYVVPEQDMPELAELRSYLRERIPEYMIPNFFMPLDAIPLSPNGKANRKALPAPEPGQQVSSVYVAPESDTEKQLVRIWSEVLGIERIGVEDNFFELGGHSINAMQTAAEAHQQFAVELELGKIFANPTIRAIASLIDQARQEQQLLLDDEPDDSFDDDEMVI